VEAFMSQVAGQVAEHVGRPVEEVATFFSPAKDAARGDLSLACFGLANKLGRPGKEGAQALAREIADGCAGGVIQSAEASGPFVNFRLDPLSVARGILTPVWEEEAYGSSAEGAGKTVVIDFSSPNIAKPFHLGHLRSTVIGWSLRQIYRYLGYDVVGVNHLGDWGTQFGFMIVAWERWKDEAEARVAKGESEIEVFADLYARINTAAKADPEIRTQARGWFKKLEDGDPEATALREFFVERSMKEFQRIYGILGISHESDAGEAFYNDKMPAMVERLKASGHLVEGKTYRETCQDKLDLLTQRLSKAQAGVAELEAAAAKGELSKKQHKKLSKLQDQIPGVEAEIAKVELGMPAEDDGKRPWGVELDGGKSFVILLKVDGGTTYTTRDVTAAYYRAQTYEPHKILYVVGEDQRDHFEPWFRVIREKLGESWAEGLEHVGFGRYMGMSTRKGTAVFLDEVLERAREEARKAADQATKKVELSDEEKERVARAIGTGALKFFDLRAERNKNIDLSTGDDDEDRIDWDRLLSLKGETGPYLQFAYARLCGILRKYEGALSADVDLSLLGEPEAQALVKALGEFPPTVRAAAERNEPSVISRYLIDLSQKTHSFVHHHRVLDAQPTDEQAAAGATPEALRSARVFLVACARKVIGQALGLLGIEALEQM
jgi:arginyl-tRNA synthetase